MAVLEWKIHANESWFWEENSEYQSLPVTFITTDTQTYTELASIAGVPLGANILLNHFSAQFQSIEPDGTLGSVQFVDLVPYHFEPMNLQISDRDSNSSTSLPIDGQLHRSQIQAEVWDTAFGDMFIVIVPELVSSTYLWYASPADSWAFSNYAETVLAEYLPTVPAVGDQTGIHVQVLNLEEEQGIMTGTATMINILVYGFAAMLMLIGMTNIVSTISTSVFARSREFAALKSVGLDQGALNKMLTFEALFSALKAITFGLPIGLLAAYLIHQAVTDTIAFAFEPPIIAITLSIIGVPAITWAVTRYSATRLRGQNLISAIRDTGQ